MVWNSPGRRGSISAGVDNGRSAARRRRVRPLKIIENRALFEFVVARLRLRWSPQQISRALRREFPEQPNMWLAAESIYQALYRH